MRFVLLAASAILSTACTAVPRTPDGAPYTGGKWEEQVLYHVFVRSFHDANGDGHGDLEGVRRKLDYLQELGVTGILLTPLYPSPFYHNYFADDFEGIDPELGDMEDYLALVTDLHARDMRLVMDTEIQYVTGEHAWYRDSFGNPASAFADFIFYNDSANVDPEPLWPGFLRLPLYDGSFADVATVNLSSPGLRAYMTGLFRYWVDPNGDGRFDDGVDGFRLDHIMDDLDWKGQQTGLFRDFWRPLFEEMRSVNPSLLFLGEQANWGYGEAVLDDAGADAVFAFPLNFAVRGLNAHGAAAALDSTRQAVRPGKHFLVFAENHDMDRLAGVLGSDPARLRAAAALNVLLEGIPILYYGQEIGMPGTKGDWGTAGNDIPMREAMEWYADADGPGMALWYRDTGPWWEGSSIIPNDGRSVEEQQADSSSLWNHYRRLIAMRKSESALRLGETERVEVSADSVLSFVRREGDERVLVLLNLSTRSAPVPAEVTTGFDRPLWPGSTCGAPAGTRSLPAYGLMACANP